MTAIAARPRVSVIVPTYNRSVAIRRTVDSVLAQTVADWELLVVSDGSTDDTEEVVHSYRDERIRLVRLERPGGPGLARTVGLDEAAAPTVAYLDHDDTYEPQHLETVLDLLDAGSAVAVTGCTRVDTDGKEVGTSSTLDLVWHPEFQVLAPLFEPTRVAHRRELGRGVGGWPTGQRGLEDWAMWLKLADAGARFATTAERTCRLELSSASRRHQLVPRFALILGRFRERDAAERALERLNEAERLGSIARMEREEWAAWYRELAIGDGLVLPRNVGTADLEQAVRDLPGERSAAPRAVAPLRDGYVVAEPLLCLDPEHAARVRQTLEYRFQRTLAAMRHALAGTGQSGPRKAAVSAGSVPI